MSQKNFSSFGDLETLIAEIVSKISGKVDKVSGKGLSTNDYTTADKNKVDALKSASTKDVPTSGNASSSQVVMGNDSRLTDSRNAKDVYSWAKAATKPTYTANEVGAIPTTQKGTASGVAELDANGKVPSSQLPSYVDDVLSYASQSAFPATGESGKIYIAEDTNKTYRWSGSAYAEISESLALGETSSTAYRGDRGKTAYDHSQLTSGNPHNVSKSDVGLGNVPNVSTNDQTPTFTQASTRNNIASGEKLSVILGKIQKFFNDLKTVAFSGSYNDLTNKPSINSVELSGNKTASQLGMANSNTFQGTIAEWNALSTAEKKAYDHASIPDSIDGGVTFPANKVVMTGGGNVEDAVDEVNSSKMNYNTPHFTGVMSSDRFNTTSTGQYAKQVLNVGDANELFIGNTTSCKNIVFQTDSFDIPLNNIVKIVTDRVGPINVGTASATRYNFYSRADSMKPRGMKVLAGIYCGAWPEQTWSSHCILAEIVNKVENSEITISVQSIGQQQNYYITMIYIYIPA